MGRITSLDGLRGLAALTVLIHHGLLLFPSLAKPYYVYSAEYVGPVAWIATFTPVHLLWEGKAGVYVFFVLSGLVLTLPAVKDPGISWIAYYPSRLVRLYLPVWAAVALAAATIMAISRTTQTGSLWLQERPDEVTPTAAIRDFTLIAGNGGLASPLWSLTWEILFSLFLPLAIFLAQRFYRAHVAILALCFASVSVGGLLDESILIYPPMFICGVIFALRLPEIKEFCLKRGAGFWISVLLIAVTASTSRWILQGWSSPEWLSNTSTGLTFVGSALFVILAIGWPQFTNLLEGKWLQLVGKASFSLYLVHEPILVASGHYFNESPMIALLVGLSITAVATPAFFLIVEKPTHLLAKIIAKKIQAHEYTSRIMQNQKKT